MSNPPVNSPKEHNAPVWLVLTMLGMVIVVWGVNIPISKILLAYFEPMNFQVTRLVLSTLVLAVVLLVKEGMPRFSAGDWKQLGILTLMMYVLYQVAFVEGLVLTHAVHAAIIFASSPFFLVLMARFWGKEPVPRYKYVMLVLGILGVLMVVLEGRFDLNMSPEIIKGDIILFVGITCWNAGSVYQKTLFETHSPLAVTTTGMVVGTLILYVFNFSDVHFTTILELPHNEFLLYLFTAFMPVAFGIYFWNWAVDNIGAARSGILATLAPVIGVISSPFIAGEKLLFIQIVGTMITFAAVYLAEDDRVFMALCRYFRKRFRKETRC
ncbi:MAG: DMT family transporter [Chlorobi bacterium]|nr:DMT family transporter [Chlorobiota bacterium]